jgi:hypothetical protein
LGLLDEGWPAFAGESTGSSKTYTARETSMAAIFHAWILLLGE